MPQKTVARTVSFKELITARNVDNFLRNMRGNLNIDRVSDVLAEVVSECSLLTEISKDAIYDLDIQDWTFIKDEFMAHINAKTSKN